MTVDPSRNLQNLFYYPAPESSLFVAGPDTYHETFVRVIQQNEVQNFKRGKMIYSSTKILKQGSAIHGYKFFSKTVACENSSRGNDLKWGSMKYSAYHEGTIIRYLNLEPVPRPTIRILTPITRL